MPVLTPQWNPVPLPDGCAPDGTPLFPPVIDTQRAVLVTGGPRMLCVFQVFTRQRLWYTVPAKVAITGFAVQASSLYVQDGPVLSGWDLTIGGCFAAVNLDTGERWAPADGDPPSPPADAVYQRSAAHAAPAAAYSAPRVRDAQLQGQAVACVFVLGSDGALHAFDDALAAPPGDFPPFDAPAVGDLAMAEIRQPSGDYACRLYYVAAKGGIVAIDASAYPPKALPGWPSTGAPDPARVLPLRVIDGLLWGGGLPGADFFARPLDPTQPPTLVVAAPNDAPHGWRDYDVAPADRLALVSDGTRTRLASYAPGTKLTDRWGLHAAARPVRVLFWDGTGADASTPGPKLVLELDETAPAGSAAPALSARVLLANTVDAPDPPHASAYPPDAIVLDTPSFGPGSFPRPTLPAVAALRARPTLAMQTLYAVARSAAGAAGRDCLVAWTIASEAAAVMPAAQAGLARLAQLALPVSIATTYIVNTPDPDTGDMRPSGLLYRGGARVTITPPAGSPPFVVTSDGNGWVTIDQRHSGAAASLDPGDPAWTGLLWDHDQLTVSGCTLSLGANRVQCTVNRWDGP